LPPSPTIADWRELSARDPDAAARELTRRLRATLPPAQRRACFDRVAPPGELLAAFQNAAAARARNSPLAGVPYTLKDLYHVAGQPPPLAGSSFPPGVLPAPAGASALPRALAAAGAVLAARTHLHEFAYGLTGENAHHGDCEHPRFPGRTTGGSSSGAAASVAATIVPFAIGTDTGGSIRVPAAFCGLHGMRLTPGDPWISDAFPLAPAFDAAGWLTRTAADMLTVNRCLLGATKNPPPRAHPPRGCFMDLSALEHSAPALRNSPLLSLPSLPFLPSLPSPPRDFARALRQASEKFAPPADALTREQIAQAFRDAPAAYAILQSAQAFDIHAPWLDKHRARYSAAVWQRIDRGRHWTPAQLETARAAQRALRRFWKNFFKTHDFLAMPATPFPALTKADCTQVNRERMLVLTVPASLAGLPVLTLPVALPSGLSAGLQIIVNDEKTPVIEWALRHTTSI